MKLNRFIAAITALCVLAAPAALAATVAKAPGTDAAATGGLPAPQARAAVARQRARHRAAGRNVYLARQVARVHGRRIAHGYELRAAAKPLRILTRSNARLRRELGALRRDRARRRAAFRAVPRSTLRAIAACESHGNPRAIGGSGRYRGIFQMTFQIWSAVGGHGDPAAAPVGEQYFRAALLYRRYGSGQWPVCGR